MSTTEDTTTEPAWAKGYDVARLKAITTLFAEHDRGLTHGQFARYSEEQAARDLQAERLLLGEDDERGVPAWAAVGYRCQRRLALRDFTGSTTTHAPAGTLVLSRLAHQGGTGSPGWQVLDVLVADNTAAGNVLVEVWQEHPAERLLVRGLRNVGVKVRASSELRGVYLSPEAATAWAGYPPEEELGLGLLPSVSLATTLGALIGEVASLGQEYAQHYSGYNARGSWQALALRGFYDEPERIEKPAEMSRKWRTENADDLARSVRDTPLRVLLPAVEAVLAALPCAGLERVRLMRLAPGGGELRRHADITDPGAGVQPGKVVRLHVPLQSNEGCRFTSWGLGGEQRSLRMAVGGCYYLDTRKPHTAVNNGAEPRVHLVADVLSDASTVAALQAAEPAPLA